MSDRYDIVVPRTYKKGGEEKTTWTKIGVAFPTAKGGYRVTLEAPNGHRLAFFLGIAHTHHFAQVFCGADPGAHATQGVGVKNGAG